jgi:ubiquinone/menaquinone biosynthesis C-methylase UbiE
MCADEIQDTEVAENHKKYLKHKALYKRFGYDIDQERDFIVNKSLPISGKILEVGTGKGHFSLALARHGYSFVSIDASKDEQRFARLNLRYFGFEHCADFCIEDACCLKFNDKSYDSIFCINMLHHLVNPHDAIDEFIRILAPNGKIVLSDFTQEGFELVDRVHASENRVHEIISSMLNETGEYLNQKGFETTTSSSKIQAVIVATKRIDS